jgi:hypothetical protein
MIEKIPVLGIPFRHGANEKKKLKELEKQTKEMKKQTKEMKKQTKELKKTQKGR